MTVSQRFNYHLKWLKRIHKFQTHINNKINKQWDKHAAICTTIIEKQKSEMQKGNE